MMCRRAAGTHHHLVSSLPHALRRVSSWALGLVLLVGTVGALAIAVYPTVTDGQSLTVLSGSMEPHVPVGAMVFTHPVDPADVVPGDVLTFARPSSPDELVTHRVIAVQGSGPTLSFTTQGDANDVADLDPVPASSVRGEPWLVVPELGRWAAVLHSPRGLGVLVLLVVAVIALAPDRPRPEGGRHRPTPVQEHSPA